MGKTYDGITTELREFIEQQRMFFVATAPLDARGHVNVSPKGLDALRVLGEKRVAYLDMTGSGNETSAHLEENGRITLMFCAFAGPPKIVRLHGSGRVILESDPEFPELLTRFTLKPEVQSLARAVIVVDVSRISDSCGFAVPEMDFVRERDQLFRWAETRDDKQGESWRAEYKRAKNAASIDGLPGIEPDERLAGA